MAVRALIPAERLNIAHAGNAHNIGHNQRKEAVQTHTGSHGKGLVGQEGHHNTAHSGGNTGGQKYTVPQGRAGIEVGQQVGVQRDDIGHRHEGGQTGHDLCANRRPVFFQFKHFFHGIVPLYFLGKPASHAGTCSHYTEFRAAFQ